MKITYLLVKLFITFVLLFQFSQPIYADNYFFAEEFNDELTNPTAWTLYNDSGGRVSFNHTTGNISLLSDNFYFPFIHSNNEIFPAADFEISFRFRYIRAGNYFGDGIVISADLPTYPGGPASDALFGIWQDGPGFMRMSSVFCPENDLNCNSDIIFQTTEFDTSLHDVKIQYINSQYIVYFDGIQILKSEITTKRPNYFWFGNPLVVNQNLGWNNFQIDYIRITDLSDNRLVLPHFSQLDSDWGSDIYDHTAADKPYGLQEISDWGCAITDAAMILKYHGYDKSPDGEDTDPGVLNEWLTDNHGYTKHGNLYWNAIGRYAKKAIKNGHVDSTLPSLEYRQTAFDYDQIREDIEATSPGLIKIRMNENDPDDPLDDDYHFVAYRGYTESEDEAVDPTVDINDPLDESDTNATLVDSYEDKNYTRIGRYIPSHTDLSYIWMYSYSDADVLLEYNGMKTGIDADGLEYSDIAGAEYYVDGSIINSDGERLNDGVKVLILPKPESGEYKVSFYGFEGEEIDAELQVNNVDSDLLHEDIIKVIDADGVIEFVLNFDRDKPIENANWEEVVPPTFGSVRQYINDQYDTGMIKSRWLKKYLLLRLRVAEYMYDRDRLNVSKILLKSMIRRVDRLSNKYIDQNTADELVLMLGELRDNLK